MLLSPVQLLSVTGIVAIWGRAAQTFTVPETVTCLWRTPRLPLVTKPPSVLQITVRMCLSVTPSVAKQVTCTPHCSSHVSPNKMHDCNYSWLLPSKPVSVFWRNWLHWRQYEVALEAGSIFFSSSSVPILKFLYACPVLSSNLLYFFHSYWTAFFLSVLSASCFLSLWSNIHFVVHFIQKWWTHAMKISEYESSLIE